MTDHKKSLNLGNDAAVKLADAFEKAHPDLCRRCYAVGVSTILMSDAIMDLSPEEAALYLADFSSAVFQAYLIVRKKAGHESPPVVSDKRKMN